MTNINFYEISDATWHCVMETFKHAYRETERERDRETEREKIQQYAANSDDRPVWKNMTQTYNKAN